MVYIIFTLSSVAPARERGLKSGHEGRSAQGRGRSREGAWIEIAGGHQRLLSAYGRSREGAWIEIQQMLHQESEQYRRSREGAWIEIMNTV